MPSHEQSTKRMPPAYVKKTGQLIHYFYAKLVIAPSAGLAENYGFIIDRYKALESGKIGMSDYNRELWIKEVDHQSTCAYCGGSGPLVADHVVPLSVSGPNSMHNILRVCRDCNSSKSDRDLIEWWDDVHESRLGPAAVSLPRLAAGIYLKLAYDWHRVQNTLELPAHDLADLQPFQTGSRSRTPLRNQAPVILARSSPSHDLRQPARHSAPRGRVEKRRARETPAPLAVVDLILGKYLYKEDVQELLEGLELSTSGSKEQLISRLSRDSRLDPKNVLGLLDRQALSSLCEELGLPSSGFFRGTLEDRVLAAILTERRAAGS